MDKGKTFEIRYVGSRFEGGRLPLEVLSDLSAFRELLLSFAKEKWRASNAGRQRLPRGFDQSFTYDLIGISNGSAVAQLDLRPRPGQGSLPGISQFEQLATASYNEILAHIDAAGNDHFSPDLSSEQVSALNRLGSGLNDHERMEFQGSCGLDGNVIFLDRHRRKRLITPGRGGYELRFDGFGELVGLHREGYISVETEKYGELEIKIEPDRVRDEFNISGSIGSPVQFSLLIELDSKDKYKFLKEVYEVELIDPERSDSVMNCMEKLTELRQLEDGWLDGSGVRPTEEAISSVVLFLNERPDLASKFRLYPMEDGGVSIEFEHDGWGLSLEFGPNGNVEIFGVEVDGPGEFEPTKFERVDEPFLKEFDKRTGR